MVWQGSHRYITHYFTTIGVRSLAVTQHHGHISFRCNIFYFTNQGKHNQGSHKASFCCRRISHIPQPTLRSVMLKFSLKLSGYRVAWKSGKNCMLGCCIRLPHLTPTFSRLTRLQTPFSFFLEYNNMEMSSQHDRQACVLV